MAHSWSEMLHYGVPSWAQSPEPAPYAPTPTLLPAFNMQRPFEALSDAARIWCSTRQALRPRLRESFLARSIAIWAVEGTRISTDVRARVRDDRFLAIGVEGGEASGCSIDGLCSQAQGIGARDGTTLLVGSEFLQEPAVALKHEPGSVQHLGGECSVGLTRCLRYQSHYVGGIPRRFETSRRHHGIGSYAGKLTSSQPALRWKMTFAPGAWRFAHGIGPEKRAGRNGIIGCVEYRRIRQQLAGTEPQS